MKPAGPLQGDSFIIGQSDLILITGANGFIGSRVVEHLLSRGFRNLRCFVRPSNVSNQIQPLAERYPQASVEVFTGNLLSFEDCQKATTGVKVILHLAAGRGEKSFPDAFMNSVVTTRNLLEACLWHGCLRRFVNISSFAVYTNEQNGHGRPLDETAPTEAHPESRGDAYVFAKVKQDQMVVDYAAKSGIPYVIMRPGYVYGPGKTAISGRVGLGSFGVFLHLGGSNPIPFTYVDNCAEAIALAGLQPGIDNETFNVVDDDLPTSRQFLRQYKKHVRTFHSIYLPHTVSYALCYLWERYAAWSEGQLPPVYNRRKWRSFWKKTRYTNAKLKERLQWQPRINMTEGMQRYFVGCRNGGTLA